MPFYRAEIIVGGVITQPSGLLLRRSDLVDAGPSQRLGRPGADATDPDHADFRLAEGAKGTLAIKTGYAPESL